MLPMPAPLARRPPFVGRETQLGALKSAVDAAELGESVLVLVAGEPGIGKTRLVAELASQVAARTVWATCWEGDGAPAYWAWRQVVRAVADGNEHAMADAMARLEEPGPTESGADPRFQLFDAVADGLASASAARPLMVVLDDLQWADESTVRMLQFLARDTRPRRLAIVGTYRDTDLDPAHPLAVGLAGLVRDGLHVSLGGLGPRDVATLVSSMEPSSSDTATAVARLHRHSGGNPFFLWELLKLESSDGAVDRAPSSVRAAVSRRLDRLSDATRETLAAASVLGAEVDVTLVSPLTQRSRGAVLTALTEAEAAGLVTPTAGAGFGFVHALVREVLYDGLEVAVRAAWHQRAADALAEHYGEARPAEVAHHLFAAALHEPDERCVGYAIRAAEHSLQIHAYEEAAHWYGRALEPLKPGDPRESDLLLHRGEARLAAGDLSGARAAYERAAALARTDGDAERLARAALGLGAGLGGFEIQLLDPLQVELLEEALAALGPEPSAMRAWVLARLSVALSLMADESRRRTLSEQAVAVARAIGDSRALGYALAAHCDATSGPDDCDDRVVATAEIVRLGAETGDRQLELLGLRLRIVALLEIGDLGAADIAVHRFALIAERLRQPLYRWYVPLWRGMRALMRRELGQAAQRCAEAEQIGAQAASGNATALTFTQWWVRRRYEGHQAEAGSAMADLLSQVSVDPRFTAGPRAVIAALTGDQDLARAALTEWLASGLPDRTRDSEWLPESAQLAQVAVAVGAGDAATRLYADLRPYAHRFCVEGIGAAFTGSVAWYLAQLAALLGRAAEADGYAAQARAAHARVGLIGDPPPLGGMAEPAAPAPATAASLEWEGATWAVSWGGKTVRVRDGKGIRDLAVLLSRPQHEVHCLELVGGSDVGSSPGPALDQQARRAYEARIRDLQADIDEARELGDPGRAERAEDELDALVQQLSEAFGLSGRARTTGSAAERARSAVSWRIRAAVRNLAEVHPELARHLQNAVRTGTWCSYRPETEVSWTMRQGRKA
jgi:tetratricopeptide (TPR) repeat protein